MSRTSLVRRVALASLAPLAACGGSPPAPKAPAAVTAAPAPKRDAAPAHEDLSAMLPKDIARSVMKRLLAHDFDGVVATFGPKMKAAVDARGLAAVWTRVEEAGGAFEALDDANERPMGTGSVVLFTARFSKAQFDVTVAVDGDHTVEGLLVGPKNTHPYAPPAYAEPASFVERDFTVGSGAWALPGTLTVPKRAADGKARVPAVVLVHGSGPNDRDETVGGIKPFRDIAWGLAARGVAVLRYEKRTRVHGAEMAKSAAEVTPKEETIDDAVFAVRALAADPAVDPKRVFVAGHSMGATLAPRIAADAPQIAGLVLLAPSARPLEDVILEQHTYVLGLDKATPEDEKKAFLSELEKQVKRVKDPALSPETPLEELPLGIGAKYWLDLRGYDAAAAAAKVNKPICVLQGGRDFQVTRADFARYEKALAGRRDATLTLFPNLSHVFAAAPAGAGPTSTPKEYEADANVDVAVVDAIARCVLGAKR